MPLRTIVSNGPAGRRRPRSIDLCGSPKKAAREPVRGIPPDLAVGAVATSCRDTIAVAHKGCIKVAKIAGPPRVQS